MSWCGALEGYVHRQQQETVAQRNTRRSNERFFHGDKWVADYMNEERRRFLTEVAVCCASFEPASVIDVGCGSGHLLVEISRLSPSARLTGVDQARSALARGKSLLPSARWIRADIYNLEVGARFDLVVCTEVLEHLHRPVEGMEQLARLCSESGRILLTVPDGATDTWKGHVNFWNESELRAFLEPFGVMRLMHVDEGRVLLAVCEPR